MAETITEEIATNLLSGLEKDTRPPVACVTVV
jgi:hypothetical protein